MPCSRPSCSPSTAHLALYARPPLQRGPRCLCACIPCVRSLSPFTLPRHAASAVLSVPRPRPIPLLHPATLVAHASCRCLCVFVADHSTCRSARVLRDQLDLIAAERSEVALAPLSDGRTVRVHPFCAHSHAFSSLSYCIHAGGYCACAAGDLCVMEHLACRCAFLCSSLPRSISSQLCLMLV